MPLLGLVEEAGELAEADSKRDLAAIGDALADIMIFALDYCSGMGWDAGDMWAVNAPAPQAGFIGILVSLGKLCHAHLKQAQGIRVSEDHEKAARKALEALFSCLRLKDASLVERTLQTWQTVKKRDWKANPVTAAPAPEPRTYEMPQTTVVKAQAIVDLDEKGPAAVPEPPKPAPAALDEEESVLDFLDTLNLVR